MTRDEIHMADLARLIAQRGRGMHALLHRSDQASRYGVIDVREEPFTEADARRHSFPVEYEPDGWLMGPVDRLLEGCQ